MRKFRSSAVSVVFAALIGLPTVAFAQIQEPAEAPVKVPKTPPAAAPAALAPAAVAPAAPAKPAATKPAAAKAVVCKGAFEAMCREAPNCAWVADAKNADGSPAAPHCQKKGASAAKPATTAAGAAPGTCEGSYEAGCRETPGCIWIAAGKNKDGSESKPRCAKKAAPATKPKPDVAAKPAEAAPAKAVANPAAAPEAAEAVEKAVPEAAAAAKAAVPAAAPPAAAPAEAK